jgi:hypothetical protein
MMVCTFRHKKDLKAAVGTDIRDRIQETSMFGREYDSNLSGVAVVGPGAYERKWYAQIWVENNILRKAT